MSLSSHLMDPVSPVRAFLRNRFPNTGEVVKECRSKLVGSETILPPASAERYPYQLIGTAFDYRLRFYFAETPLHALVAYQGMTAGFGYRLLFLSVREQAAMLERGARLCDLGHFVLEEVPLANLRAEDEVLTEVPPPLRGLKILPGGGISYTAKYIDDLDLDEVHSLSGKIFLPGDATYARPNVEEFANRLRDALAEFNPVGRRLPRPQEAVLARYCVVLALYDAVFRSGQVPQPLRLPATASPLTALTVDDLLAIPKPHWIDDLCALAWACHDDNAALLQRPAILNPTFAVSRLIGGGEADLIVDDCLVECKVTIDSTLKKLGDWLYQLLGYALLDDDDTYRIRNVAVYLPRQRIWLRWSLADLIDKLGGGHPPIPKGSNDQFGTALANLRADFRRVFEQAAISRALKSFEVGTSGPS